MLVTLLLICKSVCNARKHDTINNAEMSQLALESGSCVFIILSHHQKFLLFSNKKGFFSRGLFFREPRVHLPTFENMKLNSYSYIQLAENNVVVVEKCFSAAFKPKP